VSPRNDYLRSTIWSVAHAEAPEVVTSAWIDEQLAETFERCGIRPGLLESVAGILERRWWPEEVTFDEAPRSPVDGPSNWPTSTRATSTS